MGTIRDGSTTKHVIQDGMRIDFDVEIVMDDGVVLRADVYRPVDESQKYPILMNYGPYGKWLHFKDGFPRQWNIMKNVYPETLKGTSGRYMTWETVDPEIWVPDGYIAVRIDSRGAGRSEGILGCWAPERETLDLYDCIESFAVQPYCNGKVGLAGISYYAVTQWFVAAKNPPHLAAICPFEGSSDTYRETVRSGGIACTFIPKWWIVQVQKLQHGAGENGHKSTIPGIEGELVAGPETLSEEELKNNLGVILGEYTSTHEMVDEEYKTRMPDLSQIKVPLLSAGNWGGYGLHLRGNIEAYTQASSKEKYLEMHGLEHFTEFYTPYGIDMQKRFFGHYLKGLDTWHQAPVHLKLRNVDGTFTDRDEQEWPLARTKWTKLYFDADELSLTDDESKAPDFEAPFYALSNGLSFFTPPMKEDTEITGPMAAKLFIKSTTIDADIFVTVRVLDPKGRDVTFKSTGDPKGIVGAGWLRASHRKLDPARCLPYRPWHTHDEKQPLVPGEVYELDIEVLPTSVNIPAGYRLGFAISGKDYELQNYGAALTAYGTTYSGNGSYTHDDPVDRPKEIYGGSTTIVSNGKQRSYIMVPVIPK